MANRRSSRLFSPGGFLAFLAFLSIFLTATLSAAQSDLTPHIYLPVLLKGWPSPGRLLISEVLYASATREPDGEWVEVYNPGGRPIALQNCMIGDEETPGDREGMMRFPPGTWLGPGQAAVIANRAEVFRQANGRNPDYELVSTSPDVPDMVVERSLGGGPVNFSNAGDEVVLLCGGVIVDAVSWGNSLWPGFSALRTVTQGHSWERYPPDRDTNTAADWREALPSPGEVDTSPPVWTATLTVTPSPTLTPSPTITLTPTTSPTPAPTSTFTPTPTPTPTPAPADHLLITELYYGTNQLFPILQWFEIYNPTSETVDLSGYKIGDQTPASTQRLEGMERFPAGASIAPGQVLVIATRATQFSQVYGFLPDFELIETSAVVPNTSDYTAWASGQISLSASGDELLILDGDDQIVDVIAYHNSGYAGFQPTVQGGIYGGSFERFPANIDTNRAADWRPRLPAEPGVVNE